MTTPLAAGALPPWTAENERLVAESAMDAPPPPPPPPPPASEPPVDQGNVVLPQPATAAATKSTARRAVRMVGPRNGASGRRRRSRTRARSRRRRDRRGRPGTSG